MKDGFAPNVVCHKSFHSSSILNGILKNLRPLCSQFRLVGLGIVKIGSIDETLAITDHPNFIAVARIDYNTGTGALLGMSGHVKTGLCFFLTGCRKFPGDPSREGQQ